MPPDMTPPPQATCEKCREMHNRCSAHRRDGHPCTQYPVHGTRVCKMHGGLSPQVKAASARREQERKARAAMETFGRPVEVDPGEALLQEVHRTAGHVAWLGEQVRGLDPQALTRGTRSIQIAEKTVFQAGTTTTREVGPQIDLWLELYFRERAHLVKVCTAALAAGVEERRVRLAEQQGAALASVIRAVLDDLGLSAEQQGLVAEVVPRHLRAVAG